MTRTWPESGEVVHRKFPRCPLPVHKPSTDADAPLRDCDAPMSLVNLTFDWLRKEWADEVDFVVCASDFVAQA